MNMYFMSIEPLIYYMQGNTWRCELIRKHDVVKTFSNSRHTHTRNSATVSVNETKYTDSIAWIHIHVCLSVRVKILYTNGEQTRVALAGLWNSRTLSYGSWCEHLLALQNSTETSLRTASPVEIKPTKDRTHKHQTSPRTRSTIKIPTTRSIYSTSPWSAMTKTGTSNDLITTSHVTSVLSPNITTVHILPSFRLIQLTE
jgi:hypothetical protein